MAIKAVQPVSLELYEDRGLSYHCVDPSLIGMDANMVAIRTHILELQSENEDFLSCCAGNQKLLMNTPFRLLTEIKSESTLGPNLKGLM